MICLFELFPFITSFFLFCMLVWGFPCIEGNYKNPFDDVTKKKELYEKIIKHSYYFQTGLCQWIDTLKYIGYIDHCEHSFLKTIINEKKESLGLHKSEYFWFQGDIKPRLDFLKEKLLNNET